MIELLDIFHAFQLGVLAYVLSCVLMAQDYLLEWYLDILLILETKGPLGKWLSKPLGLCEKCLSGQLAMWYWLALNYSEYVCSWEQAFFKHIIFISFSIFFTALIKQILHGSK